MTRAALEEMRDPRLREIDALADGTLDGEARWFDAIRDAVGGETAHGEPVVVTRVAWIDRPVLERPA